MIDPDTLLRMVEAIPGRDGEVIRLAYGLDGDGERSDLEVSRIAGFRSRYRVMQIRQRVERQLQIAIGDDPEHPISLRDHARAGMLRRAAGIGGPPAKPE